MKKLLSLVLALALVFTFAVSAFAATNFANTTVTPDYANPAEKMDQITGKTKEDVHINVNADTRAIYRVDLVWEPMDFEYKLGPWDTDAHRYSTNGAKWVDDSADIVITNHSNRDVDYKVTCAPNGSWGDVTFAVTNGVNTIDYVVEAVDGKGDADVSSQTATIKISGDPKTTVVDKIVGTITVTFLGTDDQAGTAYDEDALDTPAGWGSVHESANYDRSAVAGNPPEVAP